MKSAIQTIRKSPAEIAAYLITRSTDTARTQEHLDGVSRMIENYCALFGNGIRTELRGYVAIRRRELKLEAVIKSNQRKLYDTHNWLRNPGGNPIATMPRSIAEKIA